MRHGKKFNHLGRTASHRKAMLANMACSLIERKRINTTVAKAKALRQYVEPLLTKSKDDSTQSRRVVFSYLQNKTIVSELFRDVAPKIAERPGGYTRILKTGNRLGDNAEMCFIELVDFNETYQPDKKEKKGTRRSRRGGKSSGTQAQAPAKPENMVEDTAVEEAPAVEEKVEATTETPEVAEGKTSEEVKAEAPKAEEVKSEEPKAEAAEATEEKVEAKAEVSEPEVEKTEEKKEEKKEEAPKAEAKSEDKAEAPAEEKKEEEQKDEDKEEDKS